jgi:hypothetical protein
LHFFLFGSDADFFFLISGFSTKVHGCLCAPEGAVDAVLLGFQLLLWELVYLKTLVERLLSIASKKGDRTRFFVRKNGFAIADIRMVFNYFFYRT